MLQEKKEKENKKFDYLFVAIIWVTIMPDDVGAIVFTASQLLMACLHTLYFCIMAPVVRSTDTR